jgi:hypothetical protein
MLLLLLAMAEGLLINGLGGSGSECFMLKFIVVGSIQLWSSARQAAPDFPGSFDQF